jgi:hypothetical protein
MSIQPKEQHMTKTLYLIGAVAGTVIPYYFLFQFITQNGFDVALFAQQAVANPAAAMFTADLLISSFVFWAFLYSEGRRLGMTRLWMYVVLNLGVGLSLALPLFLYFREDARDRQGSVAAPQA